MGYDGVKWSEISSQDWLTEQTLPEGVVVKLALEDLPIEEPLLFDSSVFTDEDSDFLSFDDNEKDNQEGKESKSKDESQRLKLKRLKLRIVPYHLPHRQEIFDTNSWFSQL